eukprot:26723-Pleurochrysis_carterae.AAC.6
MPTPMLLHTHVNMRMQTGGYKAADAYEAGSKKEDVASAYFSHAQELTFFSFLAFVIKDQLADAHGAHFLVTARWL